MGACAGYLFNGEVLSVLSSFATILPRKRGLVYFNCHLTVCVLCLFLAVRWVGLLSVIVAYPGHTHLFSKENAKCLYYSSLKYRRSCDSGTTIEVVRRGSVHKGRR